MDVFYYYLYGTAGWLALQAAPLIASPTLIVALLSPEVREPTLLEDYLARSLGIALATLAVLAILLTGTVPLTSSLSDSANLSAPAAATDPSDPKAPYAFPALAITTFYHCLVAFYSYTQWTMAGSLPFGISAVVGGALAAVGGWVVLFGTSGGRLLGRVGADVDKRVSGWPFKNSEADKKRRGKKGL